MAVDQFIKLDGIDGESQDSKHGKEIDILAWSWGMTQSGTFHTGGGGGAGKVNVQDISFTKHVDSASHNLIQFTCSGKHIPKAVLSVRKAGGDQLDYLKISMDDVLITSVSTGGSGGEDRLTENISLNFAKFKFEYNPQGKDGKGTGWKTATWDMQGNKA